MRRGAAERDRLAAELDDPRAKVVQVDVTNYAATAERVRGYLRRRTRPGRV
jgi:hypothetical protein